MSANPKNDGDGVDQPESEEVHENTRSSAEGVEETADNSSGGTAGAEPAAGLIGNNAGVDPRYLAQR